MSRAPNGDTEGEVSGPRLIEASVEIVRSLTFKRYLVFVVPPVITDEQVKKIAYRLLVEEGEGIEMPRTAAEGVIPGELGPNDIVEIEPVEQGETAYDVEMRMDPSGSIVVRMRQRMGELTYDL
jgi:hypothetical protein